MTALQEWKAFSQNLDNIKELLYVLDSTFISMFL
jgi:hypothetical protein